MSDTINITTTIVEDIVEITTNDNQTVVNVINQTGGSLSATLQDITDNGYETSNQIISTQAFIAPLFLATDGTSFIEFRAEDLILTFSNGSFVCALSCNEMNANYSWTLPNKSGVVALISDLASKADLVDGTVPASQLPGYVDDVLEYNNLASFPATGSSGLIYVAKDTNKTYRWSGSAYVALDEGAVLGETSSTAYRGDRGKAAYDHSQSSGNPHGTTAAQVGAYTTSQVDALLAGMVKIIAKNVSNPSITGTTSETIFTSFLISANTLLSIDTLRLSARYRKTGTAGLSIIKVYINTSNTLSGATQIAQNQTAASNLWFFIDRTFSISGGNIYGYPFSSSAPSDVIGAGIPLSSATLNPASNFYLIVTGQLGNGSDTMILDFFRATN